MQPVVCVYRQSVSLLVYFFILSDLGAAGISGGHLIPAVMRHVGRLDTVTNLANVVKYVLAKRGSASMCSLGSHWKRWCIFPPRCFKHAAPLDGCKICQVVSVPDPPRFLQETSQFKKKKKKVMGLESGIRCIRCKTLLCYKKFEDSSELQSCQITRSQQQSCEGRRTSTESKKTFCDWLRFFPQVDFMLGYQSGHGGNAYRNKIDWNQKIFPAKLLHYSVRLRLPLEVPVKKTHLEFHYVMITLGREYCISVAPPGKT